jgi:hypothetical protein
MELYLQSGFELLASETLPLGEVADENDEFSLFLAVVSKEDFALKLVICDLEVVTIFFRIDWVEESHADLDIVEYVAKEDQVSGHTVFEIGEFFVLVLELLNEEVDGDPVVFESRYHDVRVLLGRFDVVRVRRLDEPVALVKYVIDLPAAFVDIAKDASAETDIVVAIDEDLVVHHCPQLRVPKREDTL